MEREVNKTYIAKKKEYKKCSKKLLDVEKYSVEELQWIHECESKIIAIFAAEDRWNLEREKKRKMFLLKKKERKEEEKEKKIDEKIKKLNEIKENFEKIEKKLNNFKLLLNNIK